MSSMREGRIKIDSAEESACYHCICRTINGDFLFDEAMLEFLRIQIWKTAEYCGVELLTYVLLSNHFHLLVRVPKKTAISDDELVRRFRILHPGPKPVVENSPSNLEDADFNQAPLSDEWREMQLARMGDLSVFMKILKLRFSAGFKSRFERRGTLWCDRFRSLLVEDGISLEASAAYIDLNAIRAGIVSDPKEYRFCGYAEAVAGNLKARAGIISIFGGQWEEAAERYRCILFGLGAVVKPGKASIPEQAFESVMKNEGRLSTSEVLRCRLRYFSYGVVLGSRKFVEEHMARLRQRYRRVRRTCPVPISIGDTWTDLVVMRCNPSKTTSAG